MSDVLFSLSLPAKHKERKVVSWLLIADHDAIDCIFLLVTEFQWIPIQNAKEKESRKHLIIAKELCRYIHVPNKVRGESKVSNSMPTHVTSQKHSIWVTWMGQITEKKYTISLFPLGAWRLYNHSWWSLNICICLYMYSWYVSHIFALSLYIFPSHNNAMLAKIETTEKREKETKTQHKIDITVQSTDFWLRNETHQPISSRKLVK